METVADILAVNMVCLVFSLPLWALIKYLPAHTLFPKSFILYNACLGSEYALDGCAM